MVKKQQRPIQSPKEKSAFHLEFKNPTQKLSWTTFQQQDILFLLGPAGVGKSLLSMAFAINEILSRRKKRIVLTRPIVEAGESLGFLPGILDEKVAPYMLPLFDCLTKLVGPNSCPQREMINHSIDMAPLAYMRGRTFTDSVCIFDEAQNATKSQIKMFLTRLGENSKMIITGDPFQSDLLGPVALTEVVDRIGSVDGIGVVSFNNDEIVRHPLITKILEKF